MFLHIKIILKKLRKILYVVCVIGIILNTAMLVFNVINGSPVNVVVVNFLSSVALFISLAHRKKRNENGK
jgi:hypothetical protein